MYNMTHKTKNQKKNQTVVLQISSPNTNTSLNSLTVFTGYDRRENPVHCILRYAFTLHLSYRKSEKKQTGDSQVKIGDKTLYSNVREDEPESHLTKPLERPSHFSYD